MPWSPAVHITRTKRTVAVELDQLPNHVMETVTPISLPNSRPFLVEAPALWLSTFHLYGFF
jgi:hypothetical protein